MLNFSVSCHFAVTKRFVTTAVFLAVAGCGLSPNQGNSQSNNGPALAETGRVYALIDEDEGADQLRQSGQNLGYRADEVIDLPALGMIMLPFDLPQDVSGKQAIDALEDAVPSSTVGVNHAYQLQATLGRADQNFANSLMEWPRGGCSAVQSIGLIDGGVIADALPTTDVRLTQRDFAPASPSGQRHGTETASVMVDPTRLRNVSLFSANIVSRSDTGQDQASATSIVEALNWMVQNRVGVANISLAGPNNKLMALAVTEATKRGLIIVAAAGNDRRVAQVQYPAALEGVIAVTAVDARKQVYSTAVRGSHIDFAAPGVDIFVGSQKDGRYVSGTSLAAPFVSAILATQANPNPERLKASSLDLGKVGKDAIFGDGLVQANQICGQTQGA